MIGKLVDFILHIDKHLAVIIEQYGTSTYAILFFIIFAETGFVVTPFLPGDSLLFAAGALAGTTGKLSLWPLIGLLFIAAVLGNTINFALGRWIGPSILEKEKIPFVKKSHITKTTEFYEKHGGKAVILSRFLPFFRTFVPFIAGIGKMNWGRFTIYNIVGAFFWIVPITWLGYIFGEHPIVKKNFTLVVLAIIVITVLPAVIGGLRASRNPA
jgi:membrane-associated protein